MTRRQADLLWAAILVIGLARMVSDFREAPIEAGFCLLAALAITAVLLVALRRLP